MYAYIINTMLNNLTLQHWEIVDVYGSRLPFVYVRCTAVHHIMLWSCRLHSHCVAKHHWRRQIHLRETKC